MNECDVFLAALERRTAADRAAYLDAACAGDVRLRADVEALLRAHETDPQFLEALPDTAPYGPPATVPAAAGLVIADRYTLVEPAGEGGMGSVWKARQTGPVRREVAVKLIKLGMDTRQVLARFEAERQALALMDHPNIARVLDAGTGPDGRPFFVMELVDGVPITRYCDDHRLSIRDRLGLFVQVCQAVQHAHQKGVIHRDLKPSNVLVADVDGKPAVKVIDFGVAKAVADPLTEQTLQTGLGTLVGTPEYMSPEQATFGNSDVDTRSDMYALGALLYELLAGSPPLSRSGAGLLDVLRAVREDEPLRPSARLASAPDPSRIAAARGLDPRKLAGLVRGDLDWVVMKCLEKDRVRRYESAAALAADIGRHLNDEVVAARPPGAAYRARKFVRRNKRAVLAVGLLMLALLGGIVGTSLGMVRASRERDDKDEALRQEQMVAYFRRVALAHRELDANNVGRADQLLDECPDHLRGWEWHYLKRLRYGELAPLRGHGQRANDVVLTGDGRLVVSAGGDGTVKVWDADTGRRLRSITGHAGAVECVAISPDGRRLASGGADHTVRVWDTTSWRELACLRGHADNVIGVAFSPDGRRLASAGHDRTARVWDLDTGRELWTLTGHTSWVTGVAFSLDGRLLATGGADKVVRIWDPETGREVRALRGHRSEVRDVAFSPNGRELASAGLDSTVRIWDTATGASVRDLVQPGPVWTVAFSPDGRRLAAAGFDKTVRLWDPATGEEILTLRGHTQPVSGLAFSGDGRRLASAGSDGTVRVFDATPLTERGPREVFILM